MKRITAEMIAASLGLAVNTTNVRFPGETKTYRDLERLGMVDEVISTCQSFNKKRVLAAFKTTVLGKSVLQAYLLRQRMKKEANNV